jgi:hypothetical protein
MTKSELINEILSEWAYRVEDGKPNPKNSKHLAELSMVLSEMGLTEIKDELFENLKEEDSKQFSNPILNKVIKYKNEKGEDKEGAVGNLLRLAKGTAGRDAAEKMIPADGTPERDAMNKSLGGEKDGKSTEPAGEEKPKDDKGGEQPKEDPIQKAASMFDPKLDPAMGARLDKEKETQQKLADKEKAADAESQKDVETDKKEDDKFQPIEAADVNKEMPQADPETFGGGSDIPDGIPHDDLKKFNTDINKVAKEVSRAKAKGEPAPDINLCDLTVPGTNLYCDDNLGIPRDQMPQFKGKAVPGSRAASMPTDKNGEVDTEPIFKKMLEEKGIKVLQTEVPADKLKATQKDLVGGKVVGMMGALEEDPKNPNITAPIYVSRDGFVIDGHHRWAAIVAYNAQHPDAQIPMKTTVIDMDIKQAIPMCNKFAEDMGIAAKKADANKETPTQATSIAGKSLNPSAKQAVEKIKDGIKNWSEDEKEFFKKKIHKGNSPERRSFGQAFNHKVKGAWEAIKHGTEHEIHLFKEAGSGVKNFFSGGEVSQSERKALIGVAKKVAVAAAFGAVGGGLAHGALAFGKHVMMEFIPHVVAETVATGAGKAALFAGAEDEDADMMKFMEIISKKLQSEEIPDEIMANAVDSYNENKSEQPQEKTENQMKYEAVIKASVDELLSEMMTEAPKTGDPKLAAKSKETGKLVYFSTPQAKKAAIAAGTHDDPQKKVEPKAQPAAKKLGVGDFRKTPDIKKVEPTADKKVKVASDSPNLDKSFNSSTVARGYKVLNKDEKEVFNDFKNDVTKFYTAKNDDQKANIAAKMVQKYQLSASPNRQKLYFGIWANRPDAKKILGQGGIAVKLLNDLEKATGGKLGGSEGAAKDIPTLITKAAKPDLKDKSKAANDPLVKTLFQSEPLSFLEPKFYEVHGPLGKDGKLIGQSGGKNAPLYFQHSVRNNTSLDETMKVLKTIEPAISPEVRKGLEAHKVEMLRIATEMKIPSKEASQAVGNSYARMAQAIATNSDEKVTGALMKQFAEMALYDTEIAAGDECYLPSAGNFPSGDKIKITRKGTKVERVASVSVKYGLTGGKFGNFGFPGETAQYQKYHPDPSYRNRNASHPGDNGYIMGIKDTLIDDPKQFAKMIKDSGFKGICSDVNELYQIAKECKKVIGTLRAKIKPAGFADMVSHLKEVKAINDRYTKRLSKIINIDAMEEKFGYDNASTIAGGPMAFVSAMAFAGTLNTSNGLNNIEHNHQVIEKDGTYHSSTDTGSSDLKLWKLNFRAWDQRGGGLIASYNSARKDIERTKPKKSKK